MASFAFQVEVDATKVDRVSAALGPNSSTKFTDVDIGKAVKLGTAENYVAVANNDEIEGFVFSVEPWTVNGGFSFGTVQKDGRAVVEHLAGEATPLAVGDLVVAGTPVALGTAGYAKVKAGSPTTHKWRVISRMGGNGAAGTKLLIERV